MPVRSKLDECQRVNECIAKHDRSLFIIARKMKCTVQRIWEVYSRDVHGNGISNGTGNPMGMGIKHRIGNGNGRYWNYLHSHGNLFPKVLCCDEHIYMWMWEFAARSWCRCRQNIWHVGSTAYEIILWCYGIFTWKKPKVGTSLYWVSEYGLTSPSIHYRSFRKRTSLYS